MITFVILLHLRDDRECIGGLCSVEWCLQQADWWGLSSCIVTW